MVSLDHLRLVDRVRKVISRGPLFWFTPQEVIRELYAEDGTMASDACITSRFRDLRKKAYGGYTVSSRPRSGCTAWEYQLVEIAAQKAA